jgi:hypothetical protein
MGRIPPGLPKSVQISVYGRIDARGAGIVHLPPRPPTPPAPPPYALFGPAAGGYRVGRGENG